MASDDLNLSARRITTTPPAKQTYVFETVEVQKTGRTARKKSAMTGKDQILFEVEPVDKESIQWKKWVPEDQLYIID
jgi:hypothetical protein